MQRRAEAEQIADPKPTLKLVPKPQEDKPQDKGVFKFDEDKRTALNFSALGKRLAAHGDLFRNPTRSGGLTLLDHGRPRAITKSNDLYAVIVDRVHVRVVKDGKSKGGRIPAAYLNAMPQTEAFLSQFRTVDIVTSVPMYLPPHFTLTHAGYNDGGDDHRIFDIGGEPKISESTETITKFLDVMAFKSNADRTNTVGAALTVMLRNHWLGGKPIILVTATKSHGGKGTIVDFATAASKSILIPYQSEDWAFELGIADALENSPQVAVVVIDNARMGRRDRLIASACLERGTTDPEPIFFRAKRGSVRIRNNIVFAITTNFGMVSEDIMNRALPIHLEPQGDVAHRQSPIGNPKHEFLPNNKEQIAAELRGMIERWKAAGMPLDTDVRHPFTLWARTIGGILKVNGFADFLANYAVRKTIDDPVRCGLGLLGAAKPNEWYKSDVWVTQAVTLGLVKTVIHEADRESDDSRARGIGTVLHAHTDETFEVETETERLTLKLEQRRGRWGGEPHNRWRFVVVDRGTLPVDESPSPVQRPETVTDTSAEVVEF